MRLFLASLVSMLLNAAATAPQRYTFTSVGHIITMDVRFSDPYLGKRLPCNYTSGEASAVIDVFFYSG